MTDPMAGRRGPKYHRIADQLRAEIQSGELQPGEQLPAETTLTERFSVALPTLRHAISILRAEGLIESQHGVGTFVKDVRRRQRRSRSRYGRARGDQQRLVTDLEHRIIFAGQAPAPAHIAEILEIEPGATVVTRRRHLHDKTTGRLEEVGASYIPTVFGAGTLLEEATVTPKAVFLCVEDFSGKRYDHARDIWVSRLASAEETSLFDLTPGSPVQHVTHTAWASDDTVLEVSESVWPADRIMIIDEYEIPDSPETPNARSDI